MVSLCSQVSRPSSHSAGTSRAFAMRSFGCGVGRVCSSSASNSSKSFSPGRRPVYTMRMSVSDSSERRIMSRARSTIFTGSPMSITKISPPNPMQPACSTSCAASGIDMK